MAEKDTIAFTDFVDLTGSQSLVPLDNARIAQLTGLGEDRIYKSTRIRTRHILREGKTPLDLAREVLEKFFEKTGITPRDCQALALTHTEYEGDAPYMIAYTLADEMNIARDKVTALSYGCAGFPKIVSEAVPLLSKIDDGKHCLVINVETPDRMMDAHDSRATPIFASGATATSIWKGPGHRLLFAEAEDVVPPDAPKSKPIFTISRQEVEDFSGKKSVKMIFRMNGDLAYVNGAALIESAARESLLRVLGEGYKGRVIIVPHQPNARMIKGLDDMVAPRMREEHADAVADVCFVSGMEGMGNTVSCTIPSVLARINTLLNLAPPREGDIVLTPAAGICVADCEKQMSVGRGAFIWHAGGFRS